ncbi:efflux RND transporter periplasmic adaptor subunit [Sphingomonas sp. S1-29]|uniref:efflux RND transporter periplasmic adaptor subunit n=1 Tax=Sphingomonas sp. S1-29 TaxID=2991074 RepID=UPI00223FD4F5|nr:efflux RND transporter periplasmic adaptor subunit [Sphingomonas sp. S1-29]UZK69621.1 efflux RND transporter periplasmic adaptor subunit [Sphingomonas sp. S1-29]
MQQVTTNHKNPLRIAAALPLMSALMLAACSGDAAPPAPPPMQVSVANPIERQIRDWDEYVGRFEAVQDAEIRPRATGTITSVLFTDGQQVQKGQPLFVIDPRPYRAALAQAQAQGQRAQATLANARSELQRAEKLLAAQAVSREEFETNQATLRTAQADVAAARAQTETAELNLSFTTVRAPISGRISNRRVSTGNFVSDGETVLTRIVSTNPIWFVFDGAEAFYLKYRRQDQSGERGSSRDTGNPIEVQLADESGWNWRGRMDFVDNAIDPNSGTIRAHAVIQNPDGFLTPGMFGRARLLGSGTYRAMLIPDEAIVTDQTRRFVYVVGADGKTAQRPVVTGPPADGLRVVREGLKLNDRVVVAGLTALQPGMPVQAKLTRIQLKQGSGSPASMPVTTPPASDATAAN